MAEKNNEMFFFVVCFVFVSFVVNGWIGWQKFRKTCFPFWVGIFYRRADRQTNY